MFLRRTLALLISISMGHSIIVYSSMLASSVLFLNLIAGTVSSNACLLDENRTNWAGTIVFSADCLQVAASVQKIRTLVRSDEKVTVLGRRHSFNMIADNAINQLSLLSMHKVVDLDAEARTVTVDGGITYTQLCPWLDRKGFALHNLASLTDLTVAGAISTAAHGSGEKLGNLATAVAGLEMVTAAGDVVRFSRNSSSPSMAHGHGDDDDGEFHGAVVGLGGLGVIARITLHIQPRYTMRQFVYQNLPLAQLRHHFDAVLSSGYSVSLFTDWQNQTIKQVWIKIRDGDEPAFAAPAKFFGATPATENLHPLGLSAENVTQQMGVPGPWYERLPHFRPGTIPWFGNETQAEYLVPREHGLKAFMAVERLRNQIGPQLFISEIRTIAADTLWMSTAHRRASLAIHFTWRKDHLAAVQALLPVIEAALAPFQPRPHWGKLFAVPPSALRSRYEKVHDFRHLAAKYDPTGKFRNEFLNTNIFT